MQTISNNATLDLAIRELETRRSSELSDLKEHWDHTRKELNPLTLLKDEFKETIASPNFKSALLKGAIGLATGFLTKKLIVGSSAGLVTKAVGALAQTGITGLAFKNTENIKEKGASFLQGILKKMKIGSGK